MPSIVCNGVSIAYEDYGDPGNPTILLIQGLGIPSSGWSPELIDSLVSSGFRVLTPDNRDVGLSEQLDYLGVPNVPVQFLRRMTFMRVNAPYQLTDMMTDMVAFLDALEIQQAHVVGISMGSMISQLLAIHAPHRLATLTLMMTTTGRRFLPGPTKAVRNHILKGPVSYSEEDRYKYHRVTRKLLSGPKYPAPDDDSDGLFRRLFDRGMTAGGTARQMLAIMAAPGRVNALKSVRLPVQVIHGDADPLIPVQCGRETAAVIPGAVLHEISGWGHDLPAALTPRFAKLMTEHTRKA